MPFFQRHRNEQYHFFKDAEMNNTIFFKDAEMNNAIFFKVAAKVQQKIEICKFIG